MSQYSWFTVYVRAIAKINNPKIHYFIAGKGYKADYLQELAAHLDVNLHLLGYRTDIIELLNTADLYAFPSYREGLSVALMEAMSAGLPCVVSKIRGNIDLIEDGKGGYLCNPKSIDEFAEAIEKVTKNMGVYNKEVMKNFDVRVVIEKTKKIYFGIEG